MTAVPLIEDPDLLAIIEQQSGREQYPVGGLRIGVDIDDVLFPWFEIAEAACEKAGITNGIKASSWAMHKDYGCDLDDWVKAINAAFIWNSGYQCEPIEGVVDSLNALREAGHTIHLVTARGFFDYSDVIRQATVQWAYHYDVPHDTLTFAKDKTLVNVDVFADDKPSTVKALHANGVDAWLVSARHNQNFQWHKRVADFNEFAAKILGTEA